MPKIIISASCPTDLMDLIQSYLDRKYTLLEIWHRRRWLPWLNTYYAKLERKVTLEFKIGPISTRHIQKKPELVFRIGPVSTKEIR